MKTQKTRKSEHPSLVNLLNNIKDDCDITASGTYNRQDPTHFERGFQDFEYKGQRFTFWFNDCTWGVEVTVSRKVPKFSVEEIPAPAPKDDFYWKNVDIAGFYISREEKWLKPDDREDFRRIYYEQVTYRQPTANGVIKLLVHAFKHTFRPDFISLQQRQMEEMVYDHDEGYGCPAMYV